MVSRCVYPAYCPHQTVSTTMKQNRIRVIALDLEGTIISDAASVFPRPGLHAFLQWCKEHFERVVLYTCVSEDHVREIARELVAEQAVPPWFQDIEYVVWDRPYKDLKYVADATVEEILLVDDKRIFILPEQREQWVQIPSYMPPYADDDAELEILRERLLQRSIKAKTSS